MRLLVISPWYPNRVHPTDGNFVANFVALVSDRSQATVLSVIGDPRYTAVNPELVEHEESGARIVRVFYAGEGSRVQRIWARSRAWRIGLDYVGSDYDLIHAHVLVDGGIAAWQHATRFSVPYLVSEHATRWHRSWPLARLPERWLARKAAIKADRILPVTESLREALHGHGIRGHMQVLSNVVDERIFYPPTEARQHSEFELLHISDFGDRKRLDLILRAYYVLERTHPKLRLTIGGDGDVAAARELAMALDPQRRPCTEGHPVRISGPHTPAEVAGMMRQADCFVLASTSETQSVVILEALLTGLPVIATRCGGPETILTNPRLGSLVPVGDLSALVEGIRHLIGAGQRGLDERHQVGKQAAEKYGAPAIRTQLLRIYQEVMDA